MSISEQEESQMTLWQFLFNMLYTGNQTIVQWHNMAAKEFQIVNQAELAQHWSAITGHAEVTYEHINYLLQYYCDTNLLLQSGKDTFQFLTLPPDHELNGQFYRKEPGDKMQPNTYRQLEFLQFGNDSISSSTTTTPDHELEDKLFITQIHDGIKTGMPYSLSYSPTSQIDIKHHKKSVYSLPFMSSFPLMSQITSDLIDMEMLMPETVVSKTPLKEDEWDLAYSPKRRRTSHRLSGSQ